MFAVTGFYSRYHFVTYLEPERARTRVLYFTPIYVYQAKNHDWNFNPRCAAESSRDRIWQQAKSFYISRNAYMTGCRTSRRDVYCWRFKIGGNFHRCLYIRIGFKWQTTQPAGDANRGNVLATSVCWTNICKPEAIQAPIPLSKSDQSSNQWKSSSIGCAPKI